MQLRETLPKTSWFHFAFGSESIFGCCMFGNLLVLNFSVMKHHMGLCSRKSPVYLSVEELHRVS